MAEAWAEEGCVPYAWPLEAHLEKAQVVEAAAGQGEDRPPLPRRCGCPVRQHCWWRQVFFSAQNFSIVSKRIACASSSRGTPLPPSTMEEGGGGRMPGV